MPTHVDLYDFNNEVPKWNDEGTMTNEEKVLITQSVKEVNQIMANYVGIVRSDLRLHRAWDRLDMLYEETERLFNISSPAGPWNARSVADSTSLPTTLSTLTTRNNQKGFLHTKGAFLLLSRQGEFQ